jgi:hypothetical protein
MKGEGGKAAGAAAAGALDSGGKTEAGFGAKMSEAGDVAALLEHPGGLLVSHSETETESESENESETERGDESSPLPLPPRCTAPFFYHPLFIFSFRPFCVSLSFFFV